MYLDEREISTEGSHLASMIIQSSFFYLFDISVTELSNFVIDNQNYGVFLNHEEKSHC